jgi:RNA polymerase sigma-70 factor (ECF subfamily)
VTGQHCSGKTTPYQHGAVVHALRAAAETGDAAVISALLDPAVEMLTDGGGLVAANPHGVRGAQAVARRICDVLDRQPAEISVREINGQAGLVLRRGGAVSAVVCVNVRHRRVTDLWVVLNPEKLRHWNTPND